MISCASSSVQGVPHQKTGVNEATDAPVPTTATPEGTAEVLVPDTIDSLGKDIDVLERKLLSYLPPLNPKQESEVAAIKAQLDAKESKRASLELKEMLIELKED